MKQFILIIAILMLSLHVTAQQKDENNSINGGQTSFSTPQSNYDGAIEPEISTVARDFNSKGIEKALSDRNFEVAAELFRKAIESDRRCFGCQYNLGVSLINSEKYDEAIKTFTDLVAIAPLYANAHSGLGAAYGKKGLYKDSVAAYEKAVKLEPNDAILLSNFGDVLYQIKDYEKSLKWLDKAIEISPNVGVAHTNRGATLYAIGRNKEALKSLQRALELQPNSAETQNNLGVILTSLGKGKEAHKYYLEAVRLRPKWEVALYNLAISYFALNNRKDAHQQLSKLEYAAPDLAKNLRKVFFGKYLLDVSDVK